MRKKFEINIKKITTVENRKNFKYLQPFMIKSVFYILKSRTNIHTMKCHLGVIKNFPL